MILVDTNVLSDVLRGDPVWFDWSAAQLARLQPERLALNQIILAELAALFPSESEIESALPVKWIARLELPWAAAFPAAQAFLRYRRQGGTRSSPLPDFLIGAHAEVAELPIITRNPVRFRTYFPSVRLIAPE